MLLVFSSLSWLSPVVCADLSEGLVGYWRLDEVAGDMAFDDSGQGNDATLYGAGLSWMPGKGVVGGALSLDGNATTEYVEVPMYQMSASSGTVALWARIGADPQIPDTRYMFGHTTIPAYNDRIQLYMDSSDTQLDIGLGDSHVRHLAVATLTPGLWYHIALTWETGNYTVYVDGNRLASGGYAGLAELNAVAHIGNNGYTTPSQIFNGMIDDARLYTRALAEGEVRRLAARPKAHSPLPADGAVLNATSTALLWTPGDYATSHNLYLGTDIEDVRSGTLDTFRGNLLSHHTMVGLPDYPYPSGLAAGTTYYWRVDEVNDTDPNSPWKGNTWAFSTPPATAYNPTPSDNAKFVNNDVELSWSPGLQAKLHYLHFGASFEGVNNNSPQQGIPWGETRFTPGNLESDKTYYWRVDEFDGQVIRKGQIWTFTVTPAGGGLRANYFSGTGFDALVLSRVDPEIDFDWGTSSPNTWLPNDSFSIRWTGELEAAFTETYTFFATTDDGVRLWIDGWPVIDYWMDQASTERKGSIDLAAGRHSILMEYYESAGSAVAQLRWQSPSTPKQIIPQGALSLPVRAGSPDPQNRQDDVSQQPVLRWSAGEAAAWHDIYIGTDADSVANATPASPLYMGRKPIGNDKFETGELAWDNTYYWRIDEVNDLSDDSPWKGNLWSFTTADFLSIDGMEDYNNYAPFRIFETWLDGWGDEANGSLVGHPDPEFEAGEAFAETNIVHGGKQSMPFYYDNNLRHSEATMTLRGIASNWQQNDLKSLSVWHRGYPASDGSLIENSPETYTMNGSGLDIWSDSDEFHYAWATLSGQGSITARVGPIENMVEGKSLNVWAKAGVMVRQSLDPNSPHAFMATTGAQGIVFQYRQAAGAASINDTQLATVLQRPHWIRLERDFSGNFTAYHANDVNSSPDAWSKLNTATIQMPTRVYIGLALTSHQRYTRAQAAFYNVTMTGNITGRTLTSQDIGIISNDAEPMYVSIQDGSGKVATVENSDPGAAILGQWTEWNIPLTDFREVDLGNLEAISLGFGAKGTALPGGSGLVFFDDLRLYKSRCLSDGPRPSADFSGDCVVDWADLETLSGQWLRMGPDVDADLNADEVVDFKDYATLAQQWLDEQLWP